MNTASPLFDQDTIRLLEQLNIVARKAITGRERGERVSHRRGGSTEFEEHRPYTSGDDPRYVDWNVYARLGQFHVKTFRAEENVHLCVLIDRSGSMDFGTPSKFDVARQLAAALGYIALANLDRLSVFAFDRDRKSLATSVRGKQGIFDLLERLEVLEVGGETDPGSICKTPLTKTRGRMVCVVISDFYGERADHEALLRLRSMNHEVGVVQLLSSEELSPGRSGMFRLVDAETEATRTVSLSQDVLDRYQQRLGQLRQRLDRFCRSNEIRCSHFRTDLPLDQMVVGLFRRGGILGSLRGK